ncbi:MAG: DUF1579 family protein [Phycisphaerales bacterium JB043]
MSDTTAAPDMHTRSLPTEQHTLLKPFEGTFRATVTLHFGPDNSHTSTGTMVNEFDLDGRYLKQTYTGDPMPNPDGDPFPGFQGRGYWGYSTITNEYEGFWIDTASTAMATESGSVDDAGKVWTMTGDQPNPCDGPASLPKKTIITLVDDNSHTMESFITMPDGNEVKTMHIDYKRA